MNNVIRGIFNCIVKPQIITHNSHILDKPSKQFFKTHCFCSIMSCIHVPIMIIINIMDTHQCGYKCVFSYPISGGNVYRKIDTDTVSCQSELVDALIAWKIA